MHQLVFIHGPGAGGNSQSWKEQLAYFPGSLAPDMPGNPDGSTCHTLTGCVEWLRGWLWAQGKKRDLVLVGYTLGSAIAIEYALAYPEEVSGIVLSTIEMKPRPRSLPSNLDRCLAAQAGEPGAMEEWLRFQRSNLRAAPPDITERLMAEHVKVGPMAQYRSLQLLFSFDGTDRLAQIKPKVMLIRGEADPLNPPDGEGGMHAQIPGSRLERMADGGHFPITENHEKANALIADFVRGLRTCASVPEST
ncbi:MAG: alpha/beta hydrolase [Pseudomonadota bacterium]